MRLQAANANRSADTSKKVGNMSIYHPASNTWACAYGGRLNHFILKVEMTNGNMGTYRAHFACGSYSEFIRDGYAHGKPRCKKCEAAEQNAHLTPESLASSQAVINAETSAQSDSDTTPAQAQVA